MSVYWKSSCSMLCCFMNYKLLLTIIVFTDAMHEDCCLLTVVRRQRNHILLFSLGNTIEGLCFLASSKSIEQ